MREGYDYTVDVFKTDNIGVITFRALGCIDHPLCVFKIVKDDGRAQRWLLNLFSHDTIPRDVLEIINKYLKGDRDLLMCQDELIDVGFEKWAKL